LLEAVEEFKVALLAGAYWAARNVNSKNYRQVPAETREWLDRLAEMLHDRLRPGYHAAEGYARPCWTMRPDCDFAAHLDQMRANYARKPCLMQRLDGAKLDGS
jgi:hypothetical protein